MKTKLMLGHYSPYDHVEVDIDATGNLKIDIDNAVAIGHCAGSFDQTGNAVAIGYAAGHQSQGWSAVAIGWNAGLETQGQDAVAIGHRAGQIKQSQDAISIGVGAGEWNQGHDSIAIGRRAGRHNQANNSIVINATGANVENPKTESCVIKPVRRMNSLESGFVQIYYNPATGELAYLDTANSH